MLQRIGSIESGALAHRWPRGIAGLIAGVVLILGAAPVAHAQASATPSKKATATEEAKPYACDVPDRQVRHGNTYLALREYVALGESVACAKAGLAQLGELIGACDLGRADLNAHLDSDALTAFKKSLSTVPNANCANSGVDRLSPDGFSRALTWLADAVPRIPVALAGIAAVVVAFFLALALLGIPKVRGKRLPLERLWGLRTVLRPRISFEAITDQDVELDGSGVKWKIGQSMAAQVKERLQRFREEALSDQSPDMDLDFGSSGEVIAGLVSSESSLKNALDKVGEVGESTKLATALVSLGYAALPIRRLRISGVLNPPVDDNACATFSIEDGAQLEAAVTLKRPLQTSTAVTSSDYMQLVDQVAVWVQFEVTRALRKTKNNPDQADSYVRTRDALDYYAKQKLVSARTAFEEALTLDPRNWSAAIDLAVAEARLGDDYVRSVQVLTRACEDIAAPEPGDPERTTLGNYYRLSYQLAAQQMHLYLSRLASLPANPKVATSSPAGPGDPRLGALNVLKPMLWDATTMQRELAKREHPPWFVRLAWWNRLTPSERRLEKFLSRTLVPSAKLLYKVIALSEGTPMTPIEYQRVVEPVRQSLATPARSYRTAYSLACFEVAVAVTERRDAGIAKHLELALAALREGLGRSNGRGREELGRWARKDPALELLRTSDLQAGESTTYGTRFKELLDEYKIPDPATMQPAATK